MLQEPDSLSRWTLSDGGAAGACQQLQAVRTGTVADEQLGSEQQESKVGPLWGGQEAQHTVSSQYKAASTPCAHDAAANQ